MTKDLRELFNTTCFIGIGPSWVSCYLVNLGGICFYRNLIVFRNENYTTKLRIDIYDPKLL